MAFLMTDFVNLKIKSVQYFERTHKVKGCVYIFIDVSVHVCMMIYVCTIFLKKWRGYSCCNCNREIDRCMQGTAGRPGWPNIDDRAVALRAHRAQIRRTSKPVFGREGVKRAYPSAAAPRTSTSLVRGAERGCCALMISSPMAATVSSADP
jgi:hypothetical protein